MNKRGRPTDTKDSIDFKVYLQVPDAVSYDDRVLRSTNIDKVITKMQKNVRLWWKTQTQKPHIIVVGDTDKKRPRNGKCPINVSLTQLNLSDSEARFFKEGTEKIVSGFSYEDYLAQIL